MTEDALASDQLLAMASLQPGWEAQFADAPPIHPAICIGQIVAHSRLEDGRFNLLLRGICRAKIERELPGDKLYRQARVRLLTDVAQLTCGELAAEIAGLKELFSHYCRDHTCLDSEALENLLERDLPLASLVDLLAYVIDVDLGFKLKLLETEDLATRMQLVRAALQRGSSAADGAGATGSRGTYPPSFSIN